MRGDTEHDLPSLDLTAAPAAPGPAIARQRDEREESEELDAFSGDFTLSSADRIQRALADRLAAPGPVVSLTLSSVTSIDAAGLQLLLAARLAAEAAGRELRFVEPSEPVRHLLDRIGCRS